MDFLNIFRIFKLNLLYADFLPSDIQTFTHNEKEIQSIKKINQL